MGECVGSHDEDVHQTMTSYGKESPDTKAAFMKPHRASTIGGATHNGIVDTAEVAIFMGGGPTVVRAPLGRKPILAAEAY